MTKKRSRRAASSSAGTGTATAAANGKAGNFESALTAWQAAKDFKRLLGFKLATFKATAGQGPRALRKFIAEIEKMLGSETDGDNVQRASRRQPGSGTDQASVSAPGGDSATASRAAAVHNA